MWSSSHNKSQTKVRNSRGGLEFGTDVQEPQTLRFESSGAAGVGLACRRAARPRLWKPASGTEDRQATGPKDWERSKGNAVDHSVCGVFCEGPLV